MEASITLKKVGKLINDKTILAGLNFGIERGSLVAIIGDNEAGKNCSGDSDGRRLASVAAPPLPPGTGQGCAEEDIKNHQADKAGKARRRRRAKGKGTAAVEMSGMEPGGEVVFSVGASVLVFNEVHGNVTMGRVTKANADGCTYAIAYDGGMKWSKVPGHFIEIANTNKRRRVQQAQAMLARILQMQKAGGRSGDKGNGKRKKKGGRR